MITVSKLMEYAKDISVLYVEDEDDIREEIHDFLGRFFPVIDLAKNGEEGLEKYKIGNYGIVISDINMPKMNGIEMVHAIKQINEEQKIVITSAYNEPEYLMKLIDEGVESFVLKPFNNKKFLVVLYRICEFIYEKKQQHLLQKQIANKAAETQAIIDMIEHGIIVIDNGTITQVNQYFIEISGRKNKEDFYMCIKDVTSLFELHKGYVKVGSNDKLIEFLELHSNELHKVIIKKGQERNIYMLKYKKLNDENKYVITFTDITDEELLVNSDTKTGLPNIYAAMADIEYRITNNLPFIIDIIRIENIEKIVKWHGKDTGNLVDENIAELIKRDKKTLNENGVFAAYNGHNKFLLVRDKHAEGVVKTIVNKISLIAAVKEDGIFEKTNILYKPIHVPIEVQPYEKIDDVLKKIEKSFEEILL